MKLIQQLDEAANIPLEELKDRMKKDPRVSVLFRRDFDPSEIENQKEFFETLKYYFFNNQLVREYVKKREGKGTFGKISLFDWKRLTSITPEVFEKHVDAAKYNILVAAKEMISAVFSDLTSYQSGKLPTKVIDELSQALNLDYPQKEFRLYDTTIKYLDTFDLKPERQIRLYRGMIFDTDAMKEIGPGHRANIGSGLRFLKGIREGSRVAEFDWPGATTWYKNVEDARWAASQGRARLAHERMSGKEAPKTVHPDYIMGFVVSTLAKPEDVVVDLSVLSDNSGWPSKTSDYYNTVVLHPGKKLVRIVSKYTKAGEVDPVQKDSDVEDDLESYRDSLSLLGKIIKIPFADVRLTPQVLRYPSTSLGQKMPADDQVRELASKELTEKLAKSLSTIINYFNKHIRDIDVDAITASAGPEYADVLNKIKAFKQKMSSTIRSAKFRDKDNWRGTKKIYELEDANDFFENQEDLELDALIKTLSGKERFTDWMTGSAIEGIAHRFGMSRMELHNIHRKGKASQKPALDFIVRNLFIMFDEDMPADETARFRVLSNLLGTAAKNSAALELLYGIKNVVADAKK